jgi:hypothetical protein
LHQKLGIEETHVTTRSLVSQQLLTLAQANVVAVRVEDEQRIIVADEFRMMRRAATVFPPPVVARI